MLRKIKSLINSLGYDIIRYKSPHKELVLRYDIGTVLDIGANTGQYAASFFAECPNVKIISFEPVKSCFEEMTKKLSSHGTNFQAFSFALGSKNEDTFINRSSFTPSSSLLPVSKALKDNYPKSVESSKEKITVKRLDDVFPTLNISKNLLIKIDVQGFEDQVIAGGTSTISKAKVVIVETSFVALYEGQSMFDDIYRRMKNLGFSYYGDRERHYSKDGSKLLYEDSIFVKN